MKNHRANVSMMAEVLAGLYLTMVVVFFCTEHIKP